MKIPKNRTTRPILDRQTIYEITKVGGNTGLFVVFQLYTGLRMMEIVKLRWDDVLDDASEPKHVVRFFIPKQSKKGAKYGFYREIVIHEDLAEAIRGEVDRVNPLRADYIFRSESNRRSNGHITRQGMCARMRRLLSGKMGVVQPSSHALRKTFALALYEASGKDVALVMQALGHSSQEMTMNYLKVGAGDLATKYQALSFRES